MDDESGLPGTFKRLTRWATTPSQAYGVYLAVLVLVWLVSFYAGTMKPKKAPEGGPPAISALRN
jgi:hypothetical protein